jgi:hypothetical protein
MDLTSQHTSNEKSGQRVNIDITLAALNSTSSDD